MKANPPKKIKILIPLLISLFLGCTELERNNPYDPDGMNYAGNGGEPNSNGSSGSNNDSSGLSQHWQNGDSIKLDVIFRDFPVDYYGFEEFDSRNCAEKDDDHEFKWTPENRICFSGTNYIPCSQGGTQLGYAEDIRPNVYGIILKGYCNGPDKSTSCNCSSSGNTIVKGTDCNWANPVGVTKGMVESRLDYSRCSAEERAEPIHINGRYCARPLPMPEKYLCYGENLQEWFTDGNHTKRINSTITLYKFANTDIANSNIYGMNYNYNTRTNWNGSGEDIGYFPLDAYPDDMTFGKQSLSVWCPRAASYDLGNECIAWKSYGGPTDGSAAQKAVNSGKVPAKKLHNYGFAMAGSGEFGYVKGLNNIIEFIGNDDMWIFIDGELVADLGGTHLAAPAKISIKDYGSQKGWEDGSRHSVNFYYANRQTDGSNITLYISLADLSPPRWQAAD